MSTTSNVVIAALGVATLGGASLQRGSAPEKDVNVVNTPNVRVVNRPTVDVGNTVNVGVHEVRESVQFSYDLIGDALVNVLNEGLYQVPEGKRLFITHVSAYASTANGEYVPLISLTAGSSSVSYRAVHFLDMPQTAILNIAANRNIACTSHPIDFVINGGESVGMQYSRSNALDGSPNALVSVNISGYLDDMP